MPLGPLFTYSAASITQGIAVPHSMLIVPLIHSFWFVQQGQKLVGVEAPEEVVANVKQLVAAHQPRLEVSRRQRVRHVQHVRHGTPCTRCRGGGVSHATGCARGASAAT